MLSNKKTKKLVWDLILILIGNVVMGFAFNLFNVPSGIVPGGMTGLSVIISRVVATWTGVELSFIIYFVIINIFLFAFGYRVLGKKFFLYSIYGTAMYSICMRAFAFAQNITVPHNDLLLCAIFGGVLVGAGAGLVFRRGSSTGGTDIIACMINHKHKNVSLGTVAVVVNFMVISLTVITDGLTMALYGLIYIFLYSLVVDYIMQGSQGVSAYYIVSKRGNILAKEIMLRMNKKVTKFYAKGSNSDEEFLVLCCVIHFSEAHDLKHLVYQVDDQAFVFSTKVNEALNKGFYKLDDGANFLTKLKRRGKVSANLKCQDEIWALREDYSTVYSTTDKSGEDKENKENDKKEDNKE